MVMRGPVLPGREPVGQARWWPMKSSNWRRGALLEEVGYTGGRFSELLAFRCYMQLRLKRNQLLIKRVACLASSPMRNTGFVC